MQRIPGISYIRIETERAGRYFLSAKLERMQEKIIGREGRIVLTWREDSDAVICLHREHPKNQGAYHAGQLMKKKRANGGSAHRTQRSETEQRKRAKLLKRNTKKER